MDIYFCDECAARVTAADLRRGFGIKKQDTVVCGSCVEEGRGAERLEKADVAARHGAAKPALVGAGALDEHRDRAETAPDDGMDDDAQGGEGEPAKRYFDNVTVDDDTDPINQSLPQKSPSAESAALSAMAGGLSALSTNDEHQGDDVDDLEDRGGGDATGTDELEPQREVGGELDDMLAADAPAAVAAPEPQPLASESEPASPAGLADADAAADDQADSDELDPTDLALEEESGKADTEEVPAASASSVADAPGAKRGSTTKRKGSGRKSTRSKTKSGAGSARSDRKSTSKGTTSRSGSAKPSTKRTRAVKKSNAPLIYGVSFVTIGVLLTAIVAMWLNRPTGTTGPTEINVGRDFQDGVTTTFAFAKEAYASDDPDRMGEAIQRIDQLNGPLLDRFMEQAEAQGLTEQQMDATLRNMKFYDLRAMRKTLSDRKFQLDQQGL